MITECCPFIRYLPANLPTTKMILRNSRFIITSVRLNTTAVYYPYLCHRIWKKLPPEVWIVGKIIISINSGMYRESRPIISSNLSFDFSIKLWDIEMFIPETTYANAHSNYITCVRYKPEIAAAPEAGDQSINRTLISTSLDGHCLLWDSRQQFPAQGTLSPFSIPIVFPIRNYHFCFKLQLSVLAKLADTRALNGSIQVINYSSAVMTDRWAYSIRETQKLTFKITNFLINTWIK